MINRHRDQINMANLHSFADRIDKERISFIAKDPTETKIYETIKEF